jgi:hypothetical protein
VESFLKEVGNISVIDASNKKTNNQINVENKQSSQFLKDIF